MAEGADRRVDGQGMKRPPLWLLALLSLACYLIFALWFPLNPDLHRLPLPDIWTFSPSLLAGLGYLLLLGLLHALYWMAYKSVQRGKVRMGLGWILLIAAIYCLPLVATFPINASDVYAYFIQGRTVTVYGQSPLIVPPAAFPDDPVMGLTGEWTGETSPYGPLWLLSTVGVTLLSGDNLQLGLILLKLMSAAFHLAAGVLIWRYLRDSKPTERAARTLLWAWNPALLLIFVVDGHNDVMMLFWILLGALQVHRGRRWGLVIMVLAPLVKLIGLLPLPFFYIASLRKESGWRARAQLLLCCGAASLGVILLAFLPFGSPVDSILRLVREATGDGGFSPAATLVLSLRRLGLLLPARPIVVAGSFCLILFTLLLLWRAACGRSPLRASADIFVAYLLQAFKFRMWYPAWPFPWLLLDTKGDQRRLSAGLWFLMNAQLSVFVYQHLFRTTLGHDHLPAHWIGVSFVFIGPALATWGAGAIGSRIFRGGYDTSLSCADGK